MNPQHGEALTESLVCRVGRAQQLGRELFGPGWDIATATTEERAQVLELLDRPAYVEPTPSAGFWTQDRAARFVGLLRLSLEWDGETR